MTLLFFGSLLVTAWAVYLAVWGARWWHTLAFSGAVAALITLATGSLSMPPLLWIGLGLLVRLVRSKSRNQRGDVGQVTAGE